MKVYPLQEQKLVYRILHRNLREYPELLDAQFLYDLQTELQKQAQQQGVDISDHGAWDAWLGNEAVACEVRLAKREVFS